jgi:DNA-directed RNA polymerase specialized sigma subunit
MINLENTSRSEVEFAINQYIIGKNAERDRKIMLRRLIDGITFESLAEEFDISDSQVKRIVYKCERRLIGKF